MPPKRRILGTVDSNSTPYQRKKLRSGKTQSAEAGKEEHPEKPSPIAGIPVMRPTLPSRPPINVRNNRKSEAGSLSTSFNTSHSSVLAPATPIPQESLIPILPPVVEVEEKRNGKSRIPAARLPGIPHFEPFKVPFPQHQAQVSYKTKIFKSV